MQVSKLKSYVMLLASGLLFWTSCGPSEIITPSGYPVVFHVKNKGKKAAEGEYVYFRYAERKGDEILFAMAPNQPDGKVKIPTTTGTQQSRNFMIELLSMMSVGDSTTLKIPYSQELAAMYEWMPGDTIFYDVKVTAIKDEAAYQLDLEEDRKIAIEKQRENLEKAEKLGEQVVAWVEDYNAGKLNDQLIKSPTGLKKYIIEEGKGRMPTDGQKVSVHYYGVLLNGKMFDNSLRRGDTFVFPVNKKQVIPGWDEALLSMKEGEKAMVFLPPQLAYGEMGAGADIPPNSELAFYIEFVEIF